MADGPKPAPTPTDSMSGTAVVTSPDAAGAPRVSRPAPKLPDLNSLLPTEQTDVPQDQAAVLRAAGFWNQAWVQNVLPLATSLALHIGIIVLGLALYQAVKQIANPNKDQVIIPESKSIDKNAMPGGISHPGLNNDPTRDAAQDAIKNSADDGFSSSVSNSMAAAAAGAGSEESSSFEGANTSSGQGASAFNAGGGGKAARLGIPGGGGGMLPKSNFMGTGGNAAKVVYLCDTSGSMLNAKGSVIQKLKLSVNSLEAVDGQEFNIIFFNEDFTPLFPDGMKLATATNKKSAVAFIDAMETHGGNEVVRPIKFALSQKPDLIYLLTDGFQTINGSVDTKEVIKTFKDGNPDGKIHVNCIFLQTDPDPVFEKILKQIASDGHGTLLEVNKDDL